MPEPAEDLGLPEWLQSSLAARLPLLWLNENRRGVKDCPRNSLTFEDVARASADLRQFAPLLAHLFPELLQSAGIIESPLLSVPDLQRHLHGVSLAPGALA